jgi:hypothetical protein
MQVVIGRQWPEREKRQRVAEHGSFQSLEKPGPIISNRWKK